MAMGAVGQWAGSALDREPQRKPRKAREEWSGPMAGTHVLRKRVVMPCTSCTTSPCRTGLGGLPTTS